MTIAPVPVTTADIDLPVARNTDLLFRHCSGLGFISSIIHQSPLIMSVRSPFAPGRITRPGFRCSGKRRSSQIVSEEDTTIFPRKREHSMIVAPVEAAADCPDQIADVGRDRGPADTTARLPTPIQTEPAPMPAHQRLGLEDNRGFAHGREQPIEPDED